MANPPASWPEWFKAAIFSILLILPLAVFAIRTEAQAGMADERSRANEQKIEFDRQRLNELMEWRAMEDERDKRIFDDLNEIKQSLRALRESK